VRGANGEGVDEILARLIDTYKPSGLPTPIGDLGAGGSGPSLLAEYSPDLIQLDRALVEGIDPSASRRRSWRASWAPAGSSASPLWAKGWRPRARCASSSPWG
jgi:hypothetical protein